MEARTATLTEIRNWLTDYLAAKLERSPEEIDTTENLMHSGVDSLTMVALGLNIEDTFEFEIEPDFFSHFSTIDEVAKAAHDRLHSPAQEADGEAV
jgi:acyl carrier protein